MAERPRIGDVIEIPTPVGLGYAQYTHKHTTRPKFGDLIRVLPGLYDSRPVSFAELVGQEERFYTFFVIDLAVEKKAVSIVGHEDVPARCRAFPLFRCGTKNPATGRVDVWWLWDGTRSWREGTLKPEQYNLPLRSILPHKMLVKRIAEGWSPADVR